MFNPIRYLRGIYANYEGKANIAVMEEDLKDFVEMRNRLLTATYNSSEKHGLLKDMSDIAENYRDSSRLVKLARRCTDRLTKHKLRSVYLQIEEAIWGDIDEIPELKDLAKRVEI